MEITVRKAIKYKEAKIKDGLAQIETGLLSVEGVVDNYCQDHNDVVDDIKDFFYDFMRPETEFGATGYCVEEDAVYHIGGLPEPLRVPIEEENKLTSREI